MTKAYDLPNAKGPSLKFEGELLASVDTKRNNSYRWSELAVYRTKGGKVVLHQIGHSAFEGEVTLYTATVFADMDALVQHLGFTKLSQKLYARLGLDSVQVD